MAVVAVGQVTEPLTQEGRTLEGVEREDRGNEPSTTEYLTAALVNVMGDVCEPFADCVELW